MPKFLQEDLKLFSGIVSDLFPTIKEDETDYGILDKAIRRTCEKYNLKDVDGEPLPWPRPVGAGGGLGPATPGSQSSLRFPHAWQVWCRLGLSAQLRRK